MGIFTGKPIIPNDYFLLHTSKVKTILTKNFYDANTLNIEWYHHKNLDINCDMIIVHYDINGKVYLYNKYPLKYYLEDEVYLSYKSFRRKKIIDDLI